jgi:hypothetical protein
VSAAAGGACGWRAVSGSVGPVTTDDCALLVSKLGWAASSPASVAGCGWVEGRQLGTNDAAKERGVVAASTAGGGTRQACTRIFRFPARSNLVWDLYPQGPFPVVPCPALRVTIRTLFSIACSLRQREATAVEEVLRHTQVRFCCCRF